MVTATYDDVAQLLMREHASGTRYHPLSPETGVTNLEAAYAVQRRYVELMIPAAGSPAGYKIGLTSARMQKMCNIDSPLAGVVLASRVMQSGVALQIGRYRRLGLEFEVGVRLGRDLPPRRTPFTMEAIAKASEHESSIQSLPLDGENWACIAAVLLTPTRVQESLSWICATF